MSRNSGGIPWKGILAAVCLVIGLVFIGLTADSNDAGYRTVIQYPNGTLRVKFDAGWYLKWFGNTTVYPDVVTYDFDRSSNDEGATIDQTGIQVRYRDGGAGTVFGIAQFMLPVTPEEMVSLHKIYRTPNGVAHKVVKQSVDEAANLTAGLMASEDAYDNLRARYTEWMNDQVKMGKFRTTTKNIIVKDEVTGKTVSKSVPVIAYNTETGDALHQTSDLVELGITLVGSVKLDKADFETRTLEQISKKREATMAIITAKANAEKAKQDAITAEETGKANVMTAQYEEEVIKKRAIVVADREKEVAVIAASRKVDVAAQVKLEAEQKKLAAAEYKDEQILIGTGNAKRKELEVNADGQLALKLQTLENIQIAAYKYLGQNKLVPDTMIISGGGDGTKMANAGNNVDTFMNILTTKALKDLNTDLNVQGAQTVQ